MSGGASLTRRELLGRTVAAAAVLGLGSGAAACRGNRTDAPEAQALRVLGSGFDLIDPVHDLADGDLGRRIVFDVTSPVLVITRTMTQPDSFDIVSGIAFVDWATPSGTLRPVELARIERWRELSPLFTLGKPAGDAPCSYGEGDAPVRSLYVDDERSGRWSTSSVSDPLLDRYLVEWVDESSGTPNGAEPTHCWALPHAFGFDAPGYNREVVGRAPGEISWAEYFNPAWRGRVGLLDDPPIGGLETRLAAQALGLQSFADPSHPTTAEVDAHTKVLIELKRGGQFGAFWSEFEQSVDLMATGAVVIETMWYPAVALLGAQGFTVSYAAPPEGYRGWWFGLSLSARVTDRETLDSCYEFLNWWLSGPPAAVMMRQGYYSPVQETSRAHVTTGEYAYWIEGQPADADYPGPFGDVSVRKGQVRDGGSFTERACRIAAWNSWFPGLDHAALRWNEFVAA